MHLFSRTTASALIIPIGVLLLGDVATTLAEETTPEPGQIAPAGRPTAWGDFKHHEVEGFVDLSSTADLKKGDGSIGVVRGGVDYGYSTFFIGGAIVGIGLGFETVTYDVEGLDSIFSADEQIDLSSRRLSLSYVMPGRSSPWTKFAFGFADASMETDAEIGDAWSFGGVFAAAYRWSDRLSVTVGGFVSRDAQDDVRAFPIAGLDWQATETLSVGLLPAGRQRRQLRVTRILSLDYAPEPEQTTLFSLIAGYAGESFRLAEDRTGGLPGGFFETTTFAVVGAVQHDWTDSLGLTAYLGSSVYNEVEWNDARGRQIRQDEVEPSVLGGVHLAYEF